MINSFHFGQLISTTPPKASKNANHLQASQALVVEQHAGSQDDQGVEGGLQRADDAQLPSGNKSDGEEPNLKQIQADRAQQPRAAHDMQDIAMSGGFLEHDIRHGDGNDRHDDDQSPEPVWVTTRLLVIMLFVSFPNAQALPGYGAGGIGQVSKPTR